MESNGSDSDSRDPILLWSIQPFQLPKYPIAQTKDLSIDIYTSEDIFDDSFKSTTGVNYDINRVSSRNARKSELGPYKNSFLREIITSHGMGKASGTKSELVSTILSFHENKSV